MPVSGAADLFALPGVTLTYGPSIKVTLLGGVCLTVTVTDGVAFAFANVAGAPATSFPVILLVRNASGGAIGAGTFGTNYRVAGNVPAIANGNSRAILFLWTGATGAGAGMVELVRGATDIPN